MPDPRRTKKKPYILQSAAIYQANEAKREEQEYLNMQEDTNQPKPETITKQELSNLLTKALARKEAEEGEVGSFISKTIASSGVELSENAREEISGIVFDALRKSGQGRKSTMIASPHYYDDDERSFSADPLRHCLRKSVDVGAGGNGWGDGDFNQEEKNFIAEMTKRWILGEFEPKGDELIAEAITDGIAKGRITMTIGDAVNKQL